MPAAQVRAEPVVLFPDNFSNCFRPQSARAAARVLEVSGARVDLAKERLCCGRPYYDFGMLGPQIESGPPLVVLEPGCLSVFKGELLMLLPDNPGAPTSRSCWPPASMSSPSKPGAAAWRARSA